MIVLVSFLGRVEGFATKALVPSIVMYVYLLFAFQMKSRKKCLVGNLFRICADLTKVRSATVCFELGDNRTSSRVVV